MSELTQETLKELFNYDENTGLFIRLITRGGAKAGSIAGCVSRAYGYREVLINRKTYKAHRLVWLYIYGEWPKNEIDHVNHIKTDNRLCNLREVTRQQNNRNASRRKDNTSGVTGVCWDKNSQAWKAKIRINGKMIYLLTTVDKFEAACARLSANNEYGFHPNHGR